MEIKFKERLPQFRMKLLKNIMRTFVFFFCISAFSFAPSGVLSQNINVKIDVDKTMTVDEVFDLVMEQTDYKFIYQEGIFKNFPRIEVKKGTVSADSLLRQCLSSGNFNVKVSSDNTVLVEQMPLDDGTITKPQYRISGTIKDKHGQPLAGANVLEKGTINGSQSDFDGNFSLNVADEKAILVISYIGFITQEVSVIDQSNISVILIEDFSKLSEVVVIGFGKQSRETVTSSISSVDTEDLENLVFPNVTQAFQGKIPGMSVVNTSGQPGNSPEIVIRGGTSISGGSSPLYIIDGVERAEINGLRSDDIESIEVLKDATSTAIYGSRGSNGVVIITTKKGKVGKSEINFKSRLGFSSFRKENFRQIDGKDFIRAHRLGMVNSGLLNNSVVTTFSGDARAAVLGNLDNSDGWGTGNDLTKNTLYTTMLLTDDNSYLLNEEGWRQMVDPVTGDNIIFQETDWYDKNYQTGIRRENNFSFSGGDDKSTFYLGLGMLSDEGILVHTGYDLYSAVLNADRKIFDNVRIFGKLELIHEMKNQASGLSSSDYNSGLHLRNAILRSPNAPPTVKYTFQDGSLAPGVNQLMANPDYVADHVQHDERKSRWTALFGLDWDITNDINFTTKGSVYHVETLQNTSTKAYLDGLSLNTARIKRSIVSINWIKQFDGVLSYNKTVNDKHNFAATAVASYRSTDYFYSNSATKNGADDIIKTLNGGAEAHGVPTGTKTKDVLIGFTGRLIYDFDKRYLFQASIRRDGSSRFGNDTRWGNFKGISAGWNLHNEAFFNNSSLRDVISNFKIRSSYGETGNNNNLGLYTWQGAYSPGVYAGNGIIYKSGIANSGLKWETTKTFDVGLDLGLFNNRISILADYYNRKTTDLLQDLSLPANTGYSSIKTNFAELENKGYEIGINAQIVNTNNFNWDFGVNYSYNTTKVLKLPDNGVENNRIGGIEVVDPNNPSNTIWVGGYQEGQELGLIYAYKSEGVYENWQQVVEDGNIDTYANGGAGRFIMDSNFQVIDTNGDGIITTADRINKGGGDVDWADLNGDNVIDGLDRTYIGRSRAPHFGGITNTFNYKNLSLRVNMDYAFGHMIFDYEERYRNGRYTANLSPMPNMRNMWTPNNTTSSVAQFYQGDPMGNYNRGGSNLYYKGDYLALRDVTLSYNMLPKWLEKTPFSGLEIYGTGQNLYYFTKYPGYQPEKGGTSDQNNFQYPLSRTFTIGVNVTF